MNIDIGISTEDRAKIVESLSGVLADSYMLYLKTHNFHWNVTGPMFQTLHVMFQEQYTELWNALDDIAERSVKEVRKTAFARAEARWWDVREEVQALEDEQEAAGIQEVVSLAERGGGAGGEGGAPRRR